MDFDLKKRILLEKPPEIRGSRSLWIHCSSVGEFNTVRPLLPLLRERFFTVLTYFSPRAKGYLEGKKELYDMIFPLPLDLPWIVRSFEEAIKPEGLIILEREFWPSLILFTRSKKILINAYARGGFLERFLTRRYRLILTRTERDKEAFKKAGALRVENCGNLKLAGFPRERPLPPLSNLGTKLMVAGSTHRGEEEMILKSLKDLIKGGQLLLAIAPRHISRSDEVFQLSSSLGFRTSRWSRREESWEVLIIDTLGDLLSFYSVCDIAFVGGTLVPVGGHNLLEPAFFDKPVLFGPHTRKVADLEEILMDLGIGFKVRDEKEIPKKVELVLGDFRPKGNGLAEEGKRVRDCYLKEILSELEKA